MNRRKPFSSVLPQKIRFSLRVRASAKIKSAAAPNGMLNHYFLMRRPRQFVLTQLQHLATHLRGV